MLGVTTPYPTQRIFFMPPALTETGANLLNKNLAILSPKDKPWNKHKAENRQVLKIYAEYETHARKAARMWGCSGALDFGDKVDPETGESVYKLLKARFCRVRYCPICQWRRSLFWHARFYKALPGILAEHSTDRFLFLVLTVRNCEVTDLRETLQAMNKAWQRLIKRKEFACVKGWVRTTEVTRGKDDSAMPNSAHPHFNVLMQVPASYFGNSYVKKADWTRAWQEAMRLDYEPQVWVSAVKNKKTRPDGDELPRDGIAETLKYSVKPSDMTANPEWFITMTEQTHRLRFIATGGLFRNVFKSEEKITNEEMVQLGELGPDMSLVRHVMRFLWSDKAGAYMLEQMMLPGLEQTQPAPPEPPPDG